MNLWGCPREDAVRRATAAGQWTPALEAHITVCGSCRDVRLVTSALASPIPPRATPVDPVIVFARARQAARIATAARMSRVLLVGQIGSAVVIVGVILAAAQWPVGDVSASVSDTTTVWCLGGALLTAATAWMVRWSTR
jgi:predicted anti-sigma-YlaC factor YlaD